MQDLPALWLVPFQQNPRYLDRSGVLPLIHKNLRGAQDDQKAPRQRSCLIHGGGGMGKTQLAIEYAYQHREDYEHVVWIAAETEPDLVNSFATLAKRLGVSKIEDGSSRASIEAARTWLETTSMFPPITRPGIDKRLY